MTPFDREAELLRLRADLIAIEREVKFLRLRRALKRFNPTQPRDDRGRWTDSGGGSGSSLFHLVQGDPLSGYPIDLREEFALGGHAIEEHVGKSQEYLSNRVRAEARRTIEEGNEFEGLSVGSFTSLESATRLVNSTIAQNRAAVDRVAKGERPYAVFSSRFSSVTGYEAYLPTFHSEPYRRETYGVTVFILRDTRTPKGFRVQSAYPQY